MTRRGLLRNYKCFNDCTQQGCPGHTLRMNYHNTSDVIYIEVDGEALDYLDPAKWKAMTESAEGWND